MPTYTKTEIVVESLLKLGLTPNLIILAMIVAFVVGYLRGVL